MAQIDFGLLNRDAPQQAGASFDQGRRNVLAMQLAQQQQEQNALGMGKMRQDDENRNALRNISQQSGGDPQRIIQGMYAQGMPTEAMAMQGQASQQQNSDVARAMALVKLMGESSYQIYQNPDPSLAAQKLMEYGRISGGDVSAEIQKVQMMSPDQLRQWAKGHMTSAQEHEHKFQLANMGDGYQSIQYGPEGASAVGDKIPINSKPVSIDEPTIPLSDGALANAAARYNVDGTLPPLGQGKAAATLRSKILEKATELNPGADPFQVRLNQIAGKADSQSLAALTKSSDVIGSFDANFKGAISLVTPLMEKVNNGQIPGINKVSQIISYQGGDPNIKAALNQLTTAMMDYQKLVTAGSNISSAELSVGAQKRAEELLSMADNPETFKNSIDVMLKDADIKARSIIEAKTKVEERLKGRGNNKTAPKEGDKNAKGWVLHVDGKGNKAYVSPDGKEYEEVK